MTAALLQSSARAETNAELRPVEPRRDMAQLADLLQVAFRGRLDRDSLRMVRDMKRFGQAGWIGWFLGRFFLPPAAYPMGFVWEQKGQIIGNASLMPVAKPDGRWVLANVAVHPDYRRTGIATRLVRASLNYVGERGGEEILLQVDHDNRGAILLYQRMGFQVLTTRTTWHRAEEQISANSASHPAVTRRTPDKWRQHMALAQRVSPEGVIWPFSLQEDWFRSGRWDDLRIGTRPQHWVYEEKFGGVSGALTAVLDKSNTAWHMALVCDPGVVGRCEVSLLETAMRELHSSGLPFSLDYAAGLAQEELRKLGFARRRTMVWMGLATTN